MLRRRGISFRIPDLIPKPVAPYCTRSKRTMSSYTTLAHDAVIEKPVTDDRSYRFIKLENNINALLIHDPTADKAAAALDVHVGALQDREYGVPGLAHFCEHLLFMGTTKYPKESEYMNYLAQHSGRSNAYTAGEHTNYYFQVSADYFEGAMDRFAQFFISPLFSKSCKDREINAVDSENKKNLQSDPWRMYQLEKSLTNPKHAYNGFSTGNFETLHTIPTENGLNVRDILMDFHRENYSANLMGLVLIGKEDLDTLAKWAVEKFSPIADKQLKSPTYGGEHIFTPQQLSTITRAKPVSDDHMVNMYFYIPRDFDKDWSTNPTRYYSHLLGHESEGSIYYFLKQKGWVTKMYTGTDRVCINNSLFFIDFEVTPLGLDHWDDIVSTTFEYIKLITTTEPQEWIWKEFNDVSKINFKFKQKQDTSTTASRLAAELYQIERNISPNYVLSHSAHREFDAAAIKDVAQYFTPKNFKVTVISKLLKEPLPKTEQYYGTEYSHESLPQELKDKFENVSLNDGLYLPAPNKFIPEHFTVFKKKSENPLTHPYLIEDTNKLQVWFKQDDRFEVPKGGIEICFHLPSSVDTVEASSYSGLLTELIDDELNQITYYASVVGLKVRIASYKDGFYIKVSGFNDKLPVLLEQVIEKFVNFKPNSDRYEIIKEKFIQDLQNFSYENPYNQIGTHFATVLNEKLYTREEKIEFLQTKANYNDLFEFTTKTLWSNGIFAEALVHGNFDITSSRNVVALINKNIKEIKPIDEDSDKVREVISLQNFVLDPSSEVRYELTVKNPKNINSCIEYAIQVNPTSNDDRLRVLTDLFATIIRDASFSQLRTKEQLGYVVFSAIKLVRASLFYRILIQSERSTDYLEYRIEEFLKSFDKYLTHKLTDKEFEDFKDALKVLKLAKLKSLADESAIFWEEISSGKFDFEEKKRHVEILETITKPELLQFVRDYIFNESGKTAKFVFHFKAQTVPEQPRKKLIQSSVVNYISSVDLEIGSDKVDEVVDQNLDNLERIVSQIIEQLKLEESNKIPDGFSDSLLQAIKAGTESPVPAKFPTGKLYTNVGEFRSHHKKGGILQPHKPLSEFYYPEEHSRL